MTSAPSVPDDGDGTGHGAVSDPRHARVVLAGLTARYRYLDGATVSMGTTPNGEQAVAYYTDGRIVIDEAHRAGIDAILAHEIWHVIDWRDNGRVDWAEDVPPSGSDSYLAR